MFGTTDSRHWAKTSRRCHVTSFLLHSADYRTLRKTTLEPANDDFQKIPSSVHFLFQKTLVASDSIPVVLDPKANLESRVRALLDLVDSKREGMQWIFCVPTTSWEWQFFCFTLSPRKGLLEIVDKKWVTKYKASAFVFYLQTGWATRYRCFCFGGVLSEELASRDILVLCFHR